MEDRQFSELSFNQSENKPEEQQVVEQPKINLSVLPIIKWGKGTESLVLRANCEEIPVDKLTDEEKEELFALAMNLIVTLSVNKEALAIAGPQVGVPKRVFVMNYPYPRVFVNPKIVKKSNEVLVTEKCLSIPFTPVKIRRFRKVVMEANEVIPVLRYITERQTYEFEGIFAQAIQHEIDHLNGKLVIDYLRRK